MKHFKFLKIGIFIVSSLFIVSTALAGGLPDEWTEINPADYGFEYNGLTPACSNAPGTPDSEFTFFVKGGEKNNLVIFFDGGGACWDSMNCIFAPTYDPYQDEELSMFSDDMEGYGIFDQTKMENPFHDWGFVYIPYCTGDLHWGANDYDYPIGFDPATGPIYATIQHRGFVNFQAVLAYLKENTTYHRKIFVTGSSAGSYGATLAFPYIKEAFPWSRVYLLGDAGNGVLGGTFPTEGIQKWNVQMPDWIFPGGYDPSMTMAYVYTAIAHEYPWSRLAQYTTAFDANQIFFFNVMLNIDDPLAWYSIPPRVILAWHLTMKYYAYVTAFRSWNYRFYIGAGSDHTIMGYPKFYEEESGGKQFTDWVEAMIKTPNKWENQECENCLP
jgi:hypothetical protein